MEEMIAEIPNSGIRLQTRRERINDVLVTSPNRERVGVYTGVRDSIDDEPRLIILHVSQGSAAAIAGLKPHESILAINERPIEVGNGKQAQDELRTITNENPIELLVETPMGEKRLVVVSAQSSNRPLNSPIENRILPNSDILYLKFPPNESRNSINELATSIEQFSVRSGEHKGIIVDLRVMTGERRSSLLQFLSLFTNGVVFNQIDVDGNSEDITISGMESGLQDERLVPVVVLVGPDTAGAGEIFSAALQDQGRAIIIGQPTLGEVEEITTKFLPNGSRLILPTTTLVTVKGGRDIGELGVEPDIFNPIEYDQLTSQNDPILNLGVQTIRDIFASRP